MDTMPTEFTSWTSLTDIERRRLYLRDSAGMKFICLDLDAQVKKADFIAKPMHQLFQPINQIDLLSP